MSEGAPLKGVPLSGPAEQLLERERRQKMARVWRCRCGAEFEETGDRKGWGQAYKHARDTGHSLRDIIGLIDLDTGEVLVKGPDMRNAIGKGYVQPKDKPAKARGAKAEVSSTTRARMRFQDVELDPSLWILFDLARLKWPEDYDDTPQSFAQWVAECCFYFYMEHAEELGFDVLLAKSMERIAEKGGFKWGLEMSCGGE